MLWRSVSCLCTNEEILCSKFSRADMGRKGAGSWSAPTRQQKIPASKGIAGIIADPICRRHTMAPALKTARFAQKPSKIPKAVQTCPRHNKGAADGGRCIFGRKLLLLISIFGTAAVPWI
jgi:hypothetical protein